MPRERGLTVVARNKKARHDYTTGDTWEAGLVLQGTEVKSLRAGKASLVDAFAQVDEHGEVWLYNLHIPEYAFGTWRNHDVMRKRKLLLNKREIAKISREMDSP
ncbi:MAG: SsrA-binding protein, partial [Cutibacterium granulosum]|nr:SsrA-binding protein [Cutibacterium granulosum]